MVKRAQATTVSPTNETNPVNDVQLNQKRAKNEAKEPLFHISRRKSMVWWKAWIIRGIAIVLAMITCAVLIVLLTGFNPIEVYKYMFEGNFRTERKVWTMLMDLAMLLSISLAVTPAFKMRFWNLGAQGQVLVGALAAVACTHYFGPKFSTPVLLFLMLAASIVAGMLWAFIPAFFKAHWNTNETLFTLMMNYIAIQLITFTIASWVKTGSGTLWPSQYGRLPKVFDQQYFIPVAVALVLTIVVYIYLKYTKHGYEIAVVGGSENTARYVGINVKQVIIRTLLFSGALCGLAGFLLVSGKDFTVSKTTEHGMGFTAIMVSWLAKFNPIFMMFTSFLIVFLQHGASEIATATNHKVDENLSDVLTGIILFFIIGCEFFIQYKINRCGKSEEAKK